MSRNRLLPFLTALFLLVSPALALNGGDGLTAAQRSVLTLLNDGVAGAVNNNPVDLPDMPSPPTITQSPTTDPTLTVVVPYSTNTSSYRVSPGNKYIRTSEQNALYVTSANWSPATSANMATVTNLVPALLNNGEESLDWRITFVTSAPTVQLNIRTSGANIPYRFTVNNQYVARDGLITTQDFVKLAFGSSAQREITIELQYSASNFRSVAVANGFTVTAPTAPLIYAVGTGDSYCEGISGIQNTTDTIFYNYDNMIAVAAKQLGINMYQNACNGGTGYWNQAGGVPGSKSNINGQMAYWVSAQPWNVIFFFAGFNDEGQVADSTIIANALADWQLARANNPNALIVVGGIWGGNKGPGAATIASELALQKQFFAWRDPFSMFIPISTDPTAALTWLYGTGCQGTAGTGNAPTYISYDCTHENRTAATTWLNNRIVTGVKAGLAAFH